MADDINRLKRYGPALFLLGLLGGVGLGYVLFHDQPIAPARNTANAPAENSAARNLQANNFRANGSAQDGSGAERRARMEQRAQGIMDQMTPDQRERMQALRAQMRQNAGEWRSLTSEERRQRLRDQLNLTPEQEEQLQQRLQAMRDRARNRNPR